MSIIQELVGKLYPRAEHRVLFLGLETSGKTSVLYYMKLGEVVSTIPTIGFNVESIEHLHPDTKRKQTFTIWDVGGCDRIRPLWRHYYQNTTAIIFVVDSANHGELEKGGLGAFDIYRILSEDELRDAAILVLANKQDLPNAKTPEQIWKILDMDKNVTVNRHQRPMGIVGTSVMKGEGFKEALDWLSRNIGAEVTEKNKDVVIPTEKKAIQVEEKTLLEKWLEIEDEPDEEFLEKLTNYTLESWDHRTHLRIAWLYLTNYGRREGIKLIFSGIKNFIAHSSRTRKTTFHETMTYFWSHMVHYAIMATHNPSGDFKGFLLSNPQLSDGGFFLEYYEKKTMFHDPTAKEQVVLPDKKPLPSIVPNSLTKGIKLEQADSSHVDEKRDETKITRAALLGDLEFIEAFESKTLSSWSQESYIRVIWWFMKEYEKQKISGVRRAKFVDKIFEKLKSHEGKAFHSTLTYFWIQLVHNSIVSEKEERSDTFQAFWEKQKSGLENKLLHQKYFSSKLIESEDSQKEVILPDLQPFPSIIISTKASTNGK